MDEFESLGQGKAVSQMSSLLRAFNLVYLCTHYELHTFGHVNAQSASAFVWINV